MKGSFSKEAISKRVNEMLVLRDEWIKRIQAGENVHVVLQQGNSKTGKNCRTTSFIPIADCYNCGECMYDCYDLRNDCRFEPVKNDRARNSAIHKLNPAEYWKQVEECIKEDFVQELRINVGGDLNYEDFCYIKQMAERCPRTDILFFTKTYDDINRFLDENNFPSNVKPIISRWCGVECNNKHNLPESHVLYDDGKTTAPEYGAYYCGGNCSNCHWNGEGCWTLKNGESVIFKAH